MNIGFVDFNFLPVNPIFNLNDKRRGAVRRGGVDGCPDRSEVTAAIGCDNHFGNSTFRWIIFTLAVLYDLAHSPETVDTTGFRSWKLSNSVLGKPQLVV
jgi:hypothetical protein